MSNRAVWLLCAGLVTLVYGSIWLTQAPPVHDQWRLLTISLAGGIPSWDGGIASQIIGQAISLITGHDLTLANVLIRGVSAGLVFTGLVCALLATGLREWSIALLFAVFVMSGLSMVWVSADVLAAAGVAWMSWALLRGPSLWSLLPIAALVTFAKPDFILAGGAFSLYTAWQHPRRQIAVALVAGLIVALCLLSSWSPHKTPRETMSFAQHYAAVTYPDDPEAFNRWEFYRARDFGADAMWVDIVRAHPKAYAIFLVRAVQRSAVILWQSGLWPIAALALWAAWVSRREPITRGLMLFVLIHLVSLSVLSYLHVRYLGRFLVAGLIVMARALTVPSAPRVFRDTGLWIMIAVLTWQLTTFPQILADGEPMRD